MSFASEFMLGLGIVASLLATVVAFSLAFFISRGTSRNVVDVEDAGPDRSHNGGVRRATAASADTVNKVLYT